MTSHPRYAQYSFGSRSPMPNEKIDRLDLFTLTFSCVDHRIADHEIFLLQFANAYFFINPISTSGERIPEIGITSRGK